ncbi:MAG: ABC transporter permease subunit [Verrucomicrobiota bacterium]|jgi:hypothetical protein
MILLPVAHRELLVEARKGGGAWARFFSAMGGVAFFGLLWATPAQANPRMISEVVFLTMAWLLMAYAMMAGPLHTADALGREKRDGTLGLLFLTDLTALDIIAGKLAATATRSVYGVIAVMPVLALPVMLGGVSGGQVARAALAILVTLLLSLSIGLMASVLARDFKAAVSHALIGMALLGVGLDAAGWVVTVRTGSSPDALRQWSPVAMLRWSQAEAWRSPAIHASFHRAWHRQAGLAALALVVSAVMVRRHRVDWVESSASPAKPAASEATGVVGWRHVEWEVLLLRNPYGWLQRVTRPVPRTFLLSFACVTAAFVASACVALANPGTNLQMNAVVLSALLLAVLHVGIKLQFALVATRGINEDRETGALELLVVSGIGPALVQAGHRDAIVLQYRWFITTVYAAQFLMAAVVTAKGLSGIEGGLLVLVVGAAFLWVDADTLLRVGLRHGLKERDPQSAFRQTFLRVLLPGWIAIMPFGVALVTGASATVLAVMGCAWLAVSAYALKRARKRARIDIEHGFMALAASLPFDTDDWEVRDDFRRAAGAQYPSARSA